ncbi:hypothetical protein SK128_009364, partial [Halocaridina rubra]
MGNKNEKLVNVLNVLINKEGDVGGILTIFRKLLLTDFWNDGNKLNDDIKRVKKTITNAQKEVLLDEADRIKTLIDDSVLNDDMKIRVKKYVDNDVKIKQNLQLLNDNKIESSIIESLMDAKDVGIVENFKKSEEERNDLRNKLDKLEMMKMNYSAIKKML